jgi:glutamate-ammonia-ligase adenylyltransferase
LQAELDERLADAKTFEQQLNAARRFHREEAFRIGVQVLDGLVSPVDAGGAHAELAEVCVIAMARASLGEVERVHGPQPGSFVVLALGKFGGRELAEASDLDLMLVYDAPSESAGDFYTRVTQRLISALSAPTEEGALYEIDTKLRPSGSKGPMAVRLSSFQRYYDEEAWTWELQALTRARVVAGDEHLAMQLGEVIRAVLVRPRDGEKTLAQVADMRALMDRERPAKSPWDLKLAPGGFVDIEFIAQALQLTWAARAPGVLSANTGEAITRLAAAGALSMADAAVLRTAWRLWSDLQQTLRICIEGCFDRAFAPAPLQAKLATISDAADLEALETRMRTMQAEVRDVFVRLLGTV